MFKFFNPDRLYKDINLAQLEIRNYLLSAKKRKVKSRLIDRIRLKMLCSAFEDAKRILNSIGYLIDDEA